MYHAEELPRIDQVLFSFAQLSGFVQSLEVVCPTRVAVRFEESAHHCLTALSQPRKLSPIATDIQPRAGL